MRVCAYAYACARAHAHTQSHTRSHTHTVYTPPRRDFKRQMVAWAERWARTRYQKRARELAHTPAAVSWQLTPKQAQERSSNITGTDAPNPVQQPVPFPARFEFNASALPRLYVVHRHIPDADIPR